jgi:hypothetical protein
VVLLHIACRAHHFYSSTYGKNFRFHNSPLSAAPRSK